MPELGSPFSGAYGATIPDAAAWVPHGKIRFSTVRDIIENGGSVFIVPELSNGGTMNYRHVTVVEGFRSTFSPIMLNPIPRNARIK